MIKKWFHRKNKKESDEETSLYSRQVNLTGKNIVYGDIPYIHKSTVDRKEMRWNARYNSMWSDWNGMD